MKTKLRQSSDGFTHWLLLLAILLVVAAAVFYTFNNVKKKSTNNTSSNTNKSSSIDISNPPKFIQSDFIDLSKIYSVSKFRSAEGHDFSGNGETCRSMKHYFNPQVDVTVKPNKAADGRTIPPEPDGKHDIYIYSPVDGTITNVASERFPVGEQIYIQPNGAKEFTVRLFHVYKINGIQKGTAVKAGQKIGVISGYSSTDVSIEGGSENYVSYFQVLPDALFANYQKRGATSRDDFIISREYRDAHPIACNQDKQGDQSFNYPDGYNHDADTFKLSGYIKPDYTKAQQGQHNLN